MLFFMDSFLDFIAGILTCHIVRGIEIRSGTPSAEHWLETELERVNSDPDWSNEEKRELILVAKMTELIDDRKGWLLDEIKNDFLSSI